MASWFSSLYDWLEPPSAPDAASIEARLNGYDWEDINGHLDGQYQEALDNGYSKDEIDQHLGKPTDEDTQQRLSREAAARASYDDKFATGLSAPKQSIPLTPLEDLPSKRIGDYAGKPAPEVTPPTDFIEPPPVGGLFDDGSVRSSYARGLLLGDDRTPGDFAERYAGAAWGAAGDDADGTTVVRAASELAKTLPSNQDFIDQAIAIAHSQGVATTPEGVQVVKNNIVAEWADKGEPLQSIYAKAQTDPDFAASLVTPPKVDAPWWSPLTVDPEAEVYQETIWPAIQQGLSDWWGWRVQQFQEDEKNRLTWDQLKSGDYTPDQLLNDPAVGVGLGFAGSIINSVGSKLADTLFPKIVEAIKGKPEPQIPVFDPATGIVNPQTVSEQFAAPKPAERAPVEAPAEGVPQAKPGLMDFAPEAEPAEKMQALARTWIEDKAGLLEDMRLQNLGVTPDEFSPRFFQDLATKQDPATIELAKGWDAARGVLNYLSDLGGQLMRDESGALNIFRTPEQQARAGAKIASRNFMQELVIRQRSLGEQPVAHFTHGFDYTKTVAGEIENSFALVAPYMKEWEQELAKGPAGNPRGTYIGNLIEYMQGRSLGFALKHDSRLAPVADQIRYTNQFLEGLMRDAEARGLHNMDSYYEDYFRQQWKDPNKADIVFGVGKQGSSSAFQQKKYPTYMEGLDAGLEPVEPNPVHATLLGAGQTIKYLKTLEMIDEGTKNPNGFMYYAMNPRNKWDVPLDGVGSRKLFVDANGKPGEMKLYANEGAARVWNNWLSMNFYKNPVVQSGLYEKLLYAKNVFTGLNLVGPMFHAISTTWEALAGGMGVALQEMAVGAARADIREFGRGVLDLTKTVTVAPKVIEQFRRGDRGFEAYRTMAQDPILDLVLESGARIGGRQEIYRMGSAPNIVTSIMRKSFGEEYRQLGRYMIGDPNEPLEYRLFHGVTDRAVGALGHEVGRLLTTHSAPLFDYSIPRLKLGTNLEQTEMLLRQNPTMPRDQLAQRVRQITRNTDDRLGELNMDNIFWPRWVKATAQVTMLSVGWVYGTLSMTARGLGSAGYLATGGRAFAWDPAAFRNMLGYAMVWTGGNSIYQYLKTGQMPWDTDTPLRDILAGRSGNRTPEGAVERPLLPGQAKEYFDWGKIIATMVYDPMKTPEALFHYAFGKGHNLIQLMRGLVTGKDAIDHDIKNTAGGWTGFFEKQLLPIFIQNFGERKKGTGISQWESLIGVRNAPQFFENPDRFYHGLEVADQISARNEYRRAVRENARLETPRELPEPPTGAGGGRGGGGSRGAGRYEDPYLHWNSRSGQGGRGRGYSLEPGGGGGRDIEPGGLDRVFGPGRGGPFGGGGGRGRSTRGRGARSSPAYQDWSGRRGGGRMLTVEQ